MQQLKDLEEKQKRGRLQRAREEAKVRNAELRAKANEKKELDNDLVKIIRRDTQLDRELRLLSGCIRGKPLGFDRFWNRYWWVDGYGSGISGIQEYNPATGYSSRAPNLIPYGTGRLWVEGAGKPDYIGSFSGATGRQIAKRRKPGDDSADPLITMTDGLNGSFGHELTGDNWLADGEWGYYENGDQVSWHMNDLMIKPV